MNSYFLLKTGLFLHIIGLVMIAGATLISYISYRYFWKQYGQDKQKAFTVMSAMSRFSSLAGIGLGLMILSGVLMMYATHGVFHSQLWFRVKMFIVLLIVLNSIALARLQGRKLGKLLQAQRSGGEELQKLQAVRGRINVFHISQLCLLLLIFFLSAFRFN